GYAEGALLHRLTERALHAVERPIVRGHVLPTESLDAQGAVAGHEGNVHAHAAVEALEVACHAGPVMVESRPPIEPAVEAHECLEIVAGSERCIRVPVHADELGGHPLAHLGLVPRLRE